MKNKVLLLLLVFIVKSAIAQQVVIDSLKRELATAKEDTNKVNLLSELGKNYYLFKPDTAILLAQQAYLLSEKLKYPKGEALSLNRMAAAYSALGDYAKCLALFDKALAISKDLKDPRGVVQAYNNVGNTYLTQRDYVKALEYFRKAKVLLEQVPEIDLYPRMILSLNVGECFLHLHQYDSALLYLQTSYSKAKQLQFTDIYGDFERDLGEVEAAKNNWQAALAYFHQSITSYLAVEDLQDLSMTYNALADFYYKQQQQDSAIAYAKKALAAAQSSSYSQGVLDASKRLSEYYAGNDDKEAYHYLLLATAAKDSLFSQEKVKQVLSISFEQKQREQEMEAARKESRNQVIVAALVGMASVFLLLALVLYRNNRQKQHANALLQAQKHQIENTLLELKATQKQLIHSEKMASLGELTAGIAHEIQNPLNFVNNFSEVNSELITDLKNELAANNKEEALLIADDIKENEQKIIHHGRRAESIVKGMLQHSRSSSGKKEPTNINALVDESLRLSYHGLRAKDKAFNANYATDFDKNIDKVNIIPQDISRVLLNMFNNAFYAVKLLNPLKGEHYEPMVWVSTKKLNGKIEIIVKDNGNGIPQNIIDKIYQPFFTTKPAGQGTGLGLSLSYDIIKAHGGEIMVESKEGEGTAFRIVLPD